ncbi:hypothetical protein SAMN05661080_01340 [Modestobacter sp. DSM 44400]|uniref:hypothetical protein n=1 Tax=Modestobacter sp. DSM 44400 TaxID=1550230 RepID=UPI00089577DD|nr:hypothetical protein [Modestobacter sp. DSM 44400]SDX82589.1 hypothetical protein SAMN05661080_01340 [Modestobacter sp. DSM 44400]
MTELDPDRAAVDSAANDAEFPDDERGLTGTHDRRRPGTNGAEGQTARDISYEDDGVPDIADDDHPTEALAEDPEFAPVPGERARASVDVGTTAEEQAEGESLSGRLDREEPDVGGLGDVRAAESAESAERTVPQLDQDVDTDRGDDSGTDTVKDDVIATGEAPTGGEGPEDRAMHVTDG